MMDQMPARAVIAVEEDRTVGDHSQQFKSDNKSKHPLKKMVMMNGF